jgi:hypothetical protein
MFQHYCVILGELVVSTLPSYTRVSVQLLVIKYKTSHVLCSYLEWSQQIRHHLHTSQQLENESSQHPPSIFLKYHLLQFSTSNSVDIKIFLSPFAVFTLCIVCDTVC